MFGAPSIVPEVGCRALIAPGFIRSMAAGSRRGLSITYWARGVKPGRRGTSALVVFLSAEIAAASDILRRRPPGGPVLALYCLRPHPKKTGASPDNRCRLVRRLQFGYNSRMRDVME